MSADHIQPGKIYTRADLHEIFGGSTQGGIIPSRTTPNILLFTDHAKAKLFGYQDGWLAEEDTLGPVFEYTGQGTRGDQSLAGNNGSVLRHVAEGRALHHFVAVGSVGNTGTRTHRYVGQFTLDEDEPFVLRRVLDDQKNMRWVYVFRLRPVQDVERQPQDFVPAPAATKVTSEKAVPIADPALFELKPAKATVSQAAKPEKNSGKKITRKATQAVEAKRREAELSDRFLAHLEQQGHSVSRFKIRIEGLTSTFWTDLYDETDNVLYEIKGNSGRDAVRYAIGQLLDYRRHIEAEGAQLAILLPEKPEADLASLIEAAGMHLAHQDGGTFAGWPIP
ncbi:hypothetical protein ACFU9O_02455 [Streptomyces albidoflavus]